MKKNLSAYVMATALFVAFTNPLQLVAQQPRYKLLDMGTLGGPQSHVNILDFGYARVLNNHGTLAGWADTSTSDPFPSFCFNEDCYVSQVFDWRNGSRKALGGLADGLSSQASWISPNGLIAGASQNGETDPLFSGFPENRAVLWRNGHITDLGTLPEGGYESAANAINSKGQVTGWATNTISDPDSMIAPGFLPTQTRAFLWQTGAMRDIGTLGGDDAIAFLINGRGQVVGWSYTSSEPATPSCLFPLTTGSFLWENGTMKNLGGFGGTCTLASGLNDRGQVVGTSFVSGDLAFHPFLWDGHKLQDLPTLGGTSGTAGALNDAGQAVGSANLPGDQQFHAALWNNGVITDLGVLSGDEVSFAQSVNSKGQIVGSSMNIDFTQIRAFLWEDGGPMVDLNTLIPPGATLRLVVPGTINDRGEIAGKGVDANGDEHAFLLIPCPGNGASDCQEVIAGATEASPAGTAPLAQRPQVTNPSNSIRQMLRRRLGPGLHFLTPKAGLVKQSANHDSVSQIDDFVAAHERAEISVAFSTSSSTPANTYSCPAIRCSAHHTQGSVCGAKLCSIPGVVEPIWKAYDLTYQRVCFYGC